MRRDFRTFFNDLDAKGRIEFASKCGTTVGYCNKLIYGGGKVELGLADVMVAAARGKLTHRGIPMTNRAIAQMQARTSLAKEPA